MADHSDGAHIIAGSPHEQLRRIMARHLCGWISGHGAPIDHFLADADLILREAHEYGLRIHAAGLATNDLDGFVEVVTNVS